MASHNDSQVTDPAAHRGMEPVQPEVADLFGIARRGWIFIVAGTAVGVICASMLLLTISPAYKASSRIVFEKTMSRYLQTNKVTNEPIIEDYDTLGQTYVMSSESILLKVVRSLSLANDPDFVGKTDGSTPTSRIRGLFQNTAHAMGLSTNANETKIDAEKIALETLARNLTIAREDVQSVILVSFSWKDPVKAAAIVNSLVDTYIDAGVANKMSSTKVAGQVALERAQELKQQINDADHALLDFKAANNLVGSDQLTLSHAQVNVLQNQLTGARLAMAEAKAKMERIADSSDDDAALLTPDNEIVKRLRGELTDLSTRASEIEKLVGKDHMAVVKLRSRMDDVRQAIATEQRRVAGSFNKEYRLARVRYDELTEAVSQVTSSEGVHSNKQARLRELEDNASALRALYGRMLLQVTENSKVDAQPPTTPDARVLMRAVPPSQTESSKKRYLILAGGSVMGLLMGGALLLIRNFPFGVFRTATQVTQATGLACVIMPEVVDSKDRASLAAGEYTLDEPYSRFAQAMRTIGSTIGNAQRVAHSKVVCVVSSNPGEGKTTISMNLAGHLGQRSNSRVLLVDADFYRQSLTKSIASNAQAGIREALAQPEALAKFVLRKERLNLDVLPCPLRDKLPDPSELLEAAGLERLITAARETYDLVIIEVPPMSAMVDYKIIARHCDGFIFVVEWGKTSQRLVMECLSEASALLDRVLCVILNKADPSALKSIEHYKGDRFHAYYADQTGA
ncbi:GumC family protein [Bradyrhizobium erythrophlei]|uniref:non-specific protein-tyrosine kinase n=1 Tax=Bradyrhizobium erythrophlei TaxID=1437360 RepID=A0A1M7SQI5_9BRAD|nr:AAA family ATPase [Bradyrhizobium erythrophlei]SHN60692.1 capsular exopolysaccharide family [Bradyrhizobium erythrophlei]